MKKIPFILFSLILGAVILVGCGEWLAKRKAERDDAKKQVDVLLDDKTVNDNLYPLDSLVIKKDCRYLRGFEVVESNFMGDTVVAYCSFEFDTSAAKRNLRPDLTYETAFVKPEFRQYFGIPDNFTVKVIHHGKDYEYRMYYKDIKIHQYSTVGFGKGFKGGLGAHVIHFYPYNEPDEIVITPEEAIKAAVAMFGSRDNHTPTYELAYVRSPSPNTGNRTNYLNLCWAISLMDRTVYIHAIKGGFAGMSGTDGQQY
jgi:hypothetical protein